MPDIEVLLRGVYNLLMAEPGAWVPFGAYDNETFAQRRREDLASRHPAFEFEVRDEDGLSKLWARWRKREHGVT